jgi:hypothetical protein
VIKIFFDVPNYGIPGLVTLAREKRAKVGEGDMLMFVNRNRTRVKILFSDQSLFTYASRQEITIEEIKALPDLVKGKWFEDKTLKVITDALNQPITSAGAMVRLKVAA